MLGRGDVMQVILNDLLLMNFNSHNYEIFFSFRFDHETFRKNYENYISTSLTSLRTTSL